MEGIDVYICNQCFMMYMDDTLLTKQTVLGILQETKRYLCNRLNEAHVVVKSYVIDEYSVESVSRDQFHALGF